jgi:hypothetical protein
MTVQGRFEADACMKIRESLWAKGVDIPLVADIHFAPAVALRVADAFEKIRINPGNFADGIKSFENKVYNTRVSKSGGGSCFYLYITIQYNTIHYNIISLIYTFNIIRMYMKIHDYYY